MKQLVEANIAKRRQNLDGSYHCYDPMVDGCESLCYEWSGVEWCHYWPAAGSRLHPAAMLFCVNFHQSLHNTSLGGGCFTCSTTWYQVTTNICAKCPGIKPT